ncbi:PIG-L deacetylase family protein [uncultured Sphingomonas sp.]|uniref:PIG-L deacetylase family protein n=1 Tax=uncultured Sphingomonas sp. TaxID=158754 RepID=UPI0035CA068D
MAPHADDEIIGAFGVIQTLLRQGTSVGVVVVTDGAASHPSSARWPRARLAAARRKESRRALLRLGLTAPAVEFLNLPDGALVARQRDCYRAIARSLARRGDLDLLVGPAADDAHPDHRAVAAALMAAPCAARRLAYRVWPTTRNRTDGWALPTGRSAAAKRSVLGVYRTQTGAITDDPQGFAIARHEAVLFTHPVERYFRAGQQ